MKGAYYHAMAILLAPIHRQRTGEGQWVDLSCTDAAGNSKPRPGTLKGIRVVELARDAIAFAGKLLGDMGADVILVEPPGGDPARHYPPFAGDEPGEDRSLYWWHYHTSKRGVVIDLDGASGRDRFRALIATADVLLEGELPEAVFLELGASWERPLNISKEVKASTVRRVARSSCQRSPRRRDR